VFGRLVDAETGKPIPEVEALLSQDGAKPNVVMTGPDGTFRLDSVEPGRYGFATHAPHYFDETAQVKVDPGQTQRLDFRLRPRPASLAGRLFDANDKPVAGVKVKLIPEAGDMRELVSLEDGSYGTTGLSGGRYTLRVPMPGGGTLDKKVTLTAGELSSVDLKLKREAAGDAIPLRPGALRGVSIPVNP